MDYIQTVSGNVLSYDSRKFEYDMDPLQDPIVQYLTNSSRKSQLYSSLHVSNSTNSPIFHPHSSTVSAAYLSDGMVNYADYFSHLLLNYSHPMLVASAEFDMQDGAIGEDIWMKKVLKDALPSDYWTSDR